MSSEGCGTVVLKGGRNLWKLTGLEHTRAMDTLAQKQPLILFSIYDFSWSFIITSD